MTNYKTKNKTFISTLTISVCVLLSRFTGLIRDIVFASFLGTGVIAEAFYVAFRLPNTFRRIFAEGALSNAFVPFFSSKVKQNIIDANVFSAKILSILTFILVVLTLIVEIFMPTIIRIINPGFINDEHKFLLTVLMSRITFPYIVLISVASFFGSILNSIGSFWQFSIISVLLNFILTFGLILTNTYFSNAGICLCYLLIISGIAQMIFVAFFCIKKSVFPLYRKRTNTNDRIDIDTSDAKTNNDITSENNNDVILFFKKFTSTVLSSGILQINIFIDGIFASFFPGAISYLYYSDRIGQFPLSIIGYSIGVAILPSLSIAFKEKKYFEISSLQKKSINFAIFFSIPATFLIFLLSDKIINLIYQHGDFNKNDVKIVSSMLSIYIISLTFNVLMKIFFAHFYAQKDTKTPMKIFIFSLIFNIVSNCLLINIVGIYCVIISTTISSILSCFISIYFLKKKGNYYLSKDNFLFLFKIVFISFISCALAPFLLKELHLILILLISGFCYIIMCFIMKILSIKLIKEFLIKK